MRALDWKTTSLHGDIEIGRIIQAVLSMMEEAETLGYVSSVARTKGTQMEDFMSRLTDKLADKFTDLEIFYILYHFNRRVTPSYPVGLTDNEWNVFEKFQTFMQDFTPTERKLWNRVDQGRDANGNPEKNSHCYDSINTIEDHKRFKQEFLEFMKS